MLRIWEARWIVGTEEVGAGRRGKVGGGIEYLSWRLEGGRRWGESRRRKDWNGTIWNPLTDLERSEDQVTLIRSGFYSTRTLQIDVDMDGGWDLRIVKYAITKSICSLSMAEPSAQITGFTPCYSQPNQISRPQNQTISSWPALPPPGERPAQTFVPSILTRTFRRVLE